jgi:hypothetical protein
MPRLPGAPSPSCQQHPIRIPCHPIFLSFYCLFMRRNVRRASEAPWVLKGHSLKWSFQVHSRGTYGVVEGYSSCTRGVLEGCSGGCSRNFQGALLSTGPRRALGGYSRGTQAGNVSDPATAGNRSVVRQPRAGDKPTPHPAGCWKSAGCFAYGHTQPTL